jgi:hypothetical protein
MQPSEPCRATVCAVSSGSRTANLIFFRSLTLATRLTLGDLDPIYFPYWVRIHPTVNSTGGDLAVRPVISLGNRQGGNGPTAVCTWIPEGWLIKLLPSNAKKRYNFYCFSELHVQEHDRMTSDTDCAIKWRQSA